MALVILVVLLALVGGFLGDLLEFAAWLIAGLAIVGAILGLFAYRAFQRLKGKIG